MITSPRIQGMSEIRKGAVLNYLLVFLQIGVPLVLTPLIMSELGTVEFGVYMLAGTVMARLYMSDLGRTTTTRFLSEYHSRGDAAGVAVFLGNLTVLYSGIGLLIVLLGLIVFPRLGDIFPKFTSNELELYRVLYLLMLGNAALMFPMRSLIGVADAQQKFTVPALIAVLTSLTNAVGTVVILALGGRSVALMLFTIGSGLIAMLGNAAYCFIGLKARINLRGWSLRLTRGLLIFSGWMFLNQLINLLNAGTGNYIVAITRGPAETSIYTNGLQIYGNYFMLSAVLTALFLPRVVNLVVRGGSPARQTDAMILLGRSQLRILGGVLFCILFFGQEFFRLWVGQIPGAAPELSWFITVALVIPHTFVLVQSLGWQITQARDALRQRVLITGLVSMLFIAGSFVVCSYFNLRAQALWGAFTILLQLLLINLIHYRGLGLQIGRFYRETFRGTLPCVLLLSGICLLLNFLLPAADTWSTLLLKLAIFTAAYLPVVFFLFPAGSGRSGH